MMRQDVERPAVRSYAVTHPSGTVRLPTESGWDLLLYATRGVMTVHSAEGVWVVPPNRALWAPDGRWFRIEMGGRVSVRTLYFRSGLRLMAPEWRTVDVTGLVRELVIETVRRCPLDLDDPRSARLVGVLTDELVTLPDAPVRLPLPVEPRALALADLLTSEESGARPLDELAAEVGASRRTLERLFVEETTMTIGRWRQRHRLITALRLLAEGTPVTEVAVRVGYSTPSAFTAMFTRTMGRPPSHYAVRPTGG